MCLSFSCPFFFIRVRGSCLVAVFPQSPSPELSGENMDLLSGSLAQLRRFSAASHQGVDDLTCTGPSVTGRSWKALYNTWACVFRRMCCNDCCCARPWTLMRAHWTLGNEQRRAIHGREHFHGRHLWPPHLECKTHFIICSQFSVALYCLFCSIQAVVHISVLVLIRYGTAD